MPNVDTNAPLVTNSDAAMWRQDHASAIRYIEALLEERERWAPVMEKAGEWLEYRRDALETGSEDIAEAYMMADDALVAAIDAALKEGNADD